MQWSACEDRHRLRELGWLLPPHGPLQFCFRHFRTSGDMLLLGLGEEGLFRLLLHGAGLTPAGGTFHGLVLRFPAFPFRLRRFSSCLLGFLSFEILSVLLGAFLVRCPRLMQRDGDRLLRVFYPRAVAPHFHLAMLMFVHHALYGFFLRLGLLCHVLPHRLAEPAQMTNRFTIRILSVWRTTSIRFSVSDMPDL